MRLSGALGPNRAPLPFHPHSERGVLSEVKSADFILECALDSSLWKWQSAMRTLQESNRRWNVCLSDEHIGIDLRQAVKDLETNPNPCEDGLRSVCWKVRLPR